MNTYKTTEPECEECGAWCCKHQIVTVNKDKDIVEYEHWLLRAIEYQETPNGDTVFVIDQPCPQLKDNRCSVYKNRGTVCELFPDRYLIEWGLYCKLIEKRFKNIPKNGYRLLVKTNE